MAINDLNSNDAVTISDLLAIYSQQAGTDRKISVNTLVTLLQAQLTFSTYVTQRAAPSATGFTVAIMTTTANVHLILTPVAGYAAGTITLPAVAGLVDGQRVLINCTQAVTTLTINANGAIAVTGAPTTLAANAFFTLKYDLASQTWYRVG